MIPRILLSGGGTAGSVTPLLAVAQVLKQRGAEVLFVGGDQGPERDLIDRAGLGWRSIPAGKLRRYASWKNITDVIHVGRGYSAARRLMAEWKPNVVVSAGSYISVPIAWAAKRGRVPVLIHQQDIRPGLANRLMLPTAPVVTLAFATNQDKFPSSKTLVTGNPVRTEILNGSAESARQRFGLPVHRPVILVLGGGTGAAKLNELILGAVSALSQDFEVIHLTGRHRGPEILAADHYHPYAFLSDDLPDALAVADIVITRAGIGTLTELMALRKPIIVIPMPDTHQEDNADFIADQQAGVVLDQREISADLLVQEIKQLWRDDARRQSLADHLHQLYRPDAAERIADQILQLAHR